MKRERGGGLEKNVGWNSWPSLKRDKVELINEDRIFVTLVRSELIVRDWFLD